VSYIISETELHKPKNYQDLRAVEVLLKPKTQTRFRPFAQTFCKNFLARRHYGL